MLHDVINRLKKENNVTNAQLAELSGVTLSTIDKITAGINANPKLDTLRAICKVLKCSLDDLDDTPISPDKATPDEMKMVQKYRRLTDNGRATVDHVIDGLLEAGQSARDQESKDSEKILKKVAARGGTGEPLEATPDTARLLEETKEWRREQIKNSDVF